MSSLFHRPFSQITNECVTGTSIDSRARITAYISVVINEKHYLLDRDNFAPPPCSRFQRVCGFFVLVGHGLPQVLNTDRRGEGGIEAADLFYRVIPCDGYLGYRTNHG
jgi:hypothetical protein